MRWKRKKHRKQCRVYKDVFFRHRSQKEFTQTISKNLLKLVKIYWNHHTGTSHRSETNAVADRAVRRVKEGTASRPSATWTTTRMVGLCDNMLCKLLMARQHSRKDMVILLTGHQFPSIEYIPITAKDKSWIHQFGQKTLKGRFSGHVLCAWGGWSGDLMMADYEDLQEIAEIYVQKIQKLQGVFVRHKCWISVCKWNSKTSSLSKTIINSGGEPWARRWRWNRRGATKKWKQRRRVVVHVGKLFIEHHEEPRLKFLRHR